MNIKVASVRRFMSMGVSVTCFIYTNVITQFPYWQTTHPTHPLLPLPVPCNPSWAARAIGTPPVPPRI